MAKKKQGTAKPKQNAKDFTKKDFINILDAMVNPTKHTKSA